MWDVMGVSTALRGTQNLHVFPPHCTSEGCWLTTNPGAAGEGWKSRENQKSHVGVLVTSVHQCFTQN